MGGDPTVEAERHAMGAELPSVIERLKRSASPAGVISRRAFDLEAARLGLTTDEQQRRLRNGLGTLGLHVKAKRRVGASRPAASPVAGAAAAVGDGRARRAAAPESELMPSEAARRLAQARRMLARYAEADGSISKLAHDGVVRLHGLRPAEARELSGDFPITRPRPLGAVSPPGPSGAAVQVRKRKRGGAGVSAQEEALSAAVDAARTLLDETRWLRTPGKRLLTAEEEVGLAVLLRGGVGALGRDIPKEEVASFAHGSEQRRAHECLVLHNVRLVWKIAQGYQGRGLDIEDIVQHGTIGLMRAVRKFDATKGFKLSTYATWWIKQSISRAIADEGTLIRLPAHVHEKVGKVAAAERKLLGEGRARSVDNVAFVSGLTFAQVEEVRRISRPTDSLDRIIGDDTAFGDLVIGPSRLPRPDAVVIRKEIFEEVEHVLNAFTEREYHILVRRIGLDGDEPSTLDALGAAFGVTRERIRQIESKAKPVFRRLLIERGLVPPWP